MVTFTKKKIDTAKTWTERRALKRKVYKKKRTFTKYLLKFLLFLLLFWFISVVVWWYILYDKIIKPLPDIRGLSEITLPKSSTIYDRNGEVLYKVFKEKRTYVEFDKINKNMINAIIAWEDKRFWTNPWYDLIWLTRAWINAVLKGREVKWTSTISQQLVKNMLLSNERKIERKIKEIYLSYKMNKAFDKKKIMELYLNKISFWNNAYWIEQASNTYFEKSAINLTKLEASILASLPKWPTLFSPYKFKYNKREKRWDGNPLLMWYPYVFPAKLIESVENKHKQKILINKEKKEIFTNDKWENKQYLKEISELKKIIFNLKIKKLNTDWDSILVCGLKKENIKWFFSIDDSWCTVTVYSKLLTLLNQIRLKVWKNYIEYQTWRKDFILQRMLEDWYINNEEYKKAIIDWILFNFKKSKTKIKYPHFVFYVIKYLEEKYWKDNIETAWFKIHTTLDSKIQDKATEIVKKHAKNNLRKFWANNAASIVIDNKKWEIIAMVWSKDYYNKKIWWENNIITSKLQPGSTFKPFVYALAMEKNQIWPKTPVFDVKTKFAWNYEPNNFDGNFMKKMTIEKALNHSRNIPAIKMYYLAWKEKSIIDFMKKLWVNSYYDFKKYYRKKYWRSYNYWAPMALWTWEMTALELATAYSTIASWWKKKEITPILKIYDSNWAIIEDLSISKPKRAIWEGTSFLITSILTNTKARPSSWNNYLSLPWRIVAAKTWTSTKQYKKGNRKYIFPQNLWTIWYTPQYTTIVWAGNTDWTKLYKNWNGLEWAGPIWKDIMIEIHKWKESLKWNRPKSIKTVVISKNSWKIPNWVTPTWARVSGLFINSPKTFDDSYFSKQVDSRCDWKVTEKTPENAIKNIVWIRYHSLNPNNKNWEYPVSRLNTFWNFKFKNEECHWSGIVSWIKIWMQIWWNWVLKEWINNLNIWFQSQNTVKKITVFSNWKEIYSSNIFKKVKWIHIWKINIEKWERWSKNITVKVMDDQYFTETISKTFNILETNNSLDKENKEIKLNINDEKKEKIQELQISSDKNWPNIKIKNPIRWSISLYTNTTFNLRVNITDNSRIKSTNISLNWRWIFSWTEWNIVVPVSTKWMEAGIYNLVVVSTDIHFNKSTKIVKVTVLK